jgi:hypothetical protein
MGFGIVFNIGDVYYQQQLVGLYNDVRFRPNYMWSNLHMLLSLLMLFFAVGIKLLFTRSESDRSYTEECFLCGSASGALGIIFLLRMMHKGFSYKGKRVRRAAYAFRFFVSALCGFIPLWSNRATITVLYLFIFTSLIVLQVQCLILMLLPIYFIFLRFFPFLFAGFIFSPRSEKFYAWSCR